MAVHMGPFDFNPRLHIKTCLIDEHDFLDENYWRLLIASQEKQDRLADSSPM